MNDAQFLKEQLNRLFLIFCQKKQNFLTILGIS